MCEGVAYLVSDSGEELMMEEVMLVWFKDGRLVLVNEDGDERSLDGVKEIRIDMLRHEVRVIVK
ncbi:MAG: CooT family nickel-binding protein [Candidatus Korarchaeota archaeon NZ13-K]|nr:MAG: CooT family nickel-binding protein [Candidatus Korarchaeota archaeon NZ13-K]